MLTGEFSGVSPFIYASWNAGSLKKKRKEFITHYPHEMIQIQTGSEAYLAPVVIPFEMDGL
jgi:hypothetical protein